MDILHDQEQEPPVSGLELLVAEVGLKSNEQLDDLRNQIVEAVGRGDSATDLLGRYQHGYEAQAEQFKDVLYYRAQVGVVVAMGLLGKNVGLSDYALESFRDALMWAEVKGFEDLADLIRAELNS